MSRYGANSPGEYTPRRVYSNADPYAYAPFPAYFSHPAAAQAYALNSPTVVYAGDWSADDKIVLGSYVEDSRNSVMLARPSAYTPGQFDILSETALTFPVSKLMFDRSGTRVLAASDSLRLFTAAESLELRARYVKAAHTTAPLTSFDWHPFDENLALTASIDTTCTLWDLTKQVVKTQLIAHDRAVYDVQFVPQTQSQFVSAGADGSARLFDLRALNNSTIIYEQDRPLLRLGVSPQDVNVLFALSMESASVLVLDIRSLRNPVQVLEGHQQSVNAAQWISSPNGGCWLATAGDDCQILVWDPMKGALVGAYSGSGHINNLLKSASGEWLGCISGKSMQAVSTRMTAFA